MIPVIVLAGGRGTRLAAVSGGLPKPLVSVAGRPFIEHVLDRLTDAGFDTLHLAVSHRWELLRDHLGDAYRSASLSYAIEKEPLGTGGAILRCLQERTLERALVVNADTLFRVDLRGLVEAHLAEGAALTIALRRMASTGRYGVVVRDDAGRVIGFHEKDGRHPGLINGGIYVVEGRAFGDTPWPERFSFERDFLEKRVCELRPLGVAYDGYFIDIGIPEDLERARQELATAAWAAGGLPRDGVINDFQGSPPLSQRRAGTSSPASTGDAVVCPRSPAAGDPGLTPISPQASPHGTQALREL